MTTMNTRLKMSEMTLSTNLVLILSLFSSKITIVNSDPAIVTNRESEDLILKPGYPGYTPPLFRLAPRRDERSLFYKKTPGVDKFQSPVHELYMRPYNYVSYSMGGSKPVQYNYQYQTPDYPSYSAYNPRPKPISFTPSYSPTPLPKYPPPVPHHSPSLPLHPTPAPHHSPSLP